MFFKEEFHTSFPFFVRCYSVLHNNDNNKQDGERAPKEVLDFFLVATFLLFLFVLFTFGVFIGLFCEREEVVVLGQREPLSLCECATTKKWLDAEEWVLLWKCDLLFFPRLGGSKHYFSLSATHHLYCGGFRTYVLALVCPLLLLFSSSLF